METVEWANTSCQVPGCTAKAKWISNGGGFRYCDEHKKRLGKRKHKFKRLKK